MIDLSWLSCQCCNNDQNTQTTMLITKSTQTNSDWIDTQLSIKQTDVYNDLVDKMNIKKTPRNRIYL